MIKVLTLITLNLRVIKVATLITLTELLCVRQMKILILLYIMRLIYVYIYACPQKLSLSVHSLQSGCTRGRRHSNEARTCDYSIARAATVGVIIINCV